MRCAVGGAGAKQAAFERGYHPIVIPEPVTGEARHGDTLVAEGRIEA